MIEFQPVPPEWRFTSTSETPNGIRVEVIITVPEKAAGVDVIELTEVAQMACARVTSAAKGAGQTDARTRAAF
jgi:phage portal protein BeeE